MKKILILILTLVFLCPTPSVGQIRAEEPNAIKTANYFLLSGRTLDDETILTQLADYDLLVLPVEAQSFNPTFPAKIRQLNPDIILLAYVPSVSWNSIWQDRVHRSLKQGIQDSFWLKDQGGQTVSIWPGTSALDLTGAWNEYLSSFVANEVLNTNYWDGVFYDEVSDSISWVPGVTISNQDWINAYTKLFKSTREKVGNQKIIISNGSSNLQHANYVNGRMFESFPTPWEAGGNWHEIINRYFKLGEKVPYEPIIILNGDTQNSGNKNDFKKMRFGLTSTLLGGGFFGFDFGTESHQQIWRYDEFEAYIGSPSDDAFQRSDGVWERNFSNGKVLVNPTNSEKRIRLDGEYEKIRGTQDKTVNDGSIISRVTVFAKDGLLLLRPLEEIKNAVFLNGAFARVFDKNGYATRNGFFAYDSQFFGGMQVIIKDMDGDGNLEKVAADGNQVFIYNEDGTLHASFYPYTANYRGGINISVGDLESDGTVEIVTGTENGGGAQVRIFNSDGVLINPGFFAYDKDFRGGVNVTIGDLNGDGTIEIICGAGVGGGPHVRIFNKDGKLINPGFFAYDPSFRGGVNVSSNDLNGDGIDEIVTGQGLGGSPEIRVYDKDGNLQAKPFFAFDRNTRKGVEVSTADLDGDGIAEIIALTREVFTLSSF